MNTTLTNKTAPNGFRKYLIIAILLHVILFAFLIFELHFSSQASSQPANNPPIINAQAITSPSDSRKVEKQLADLQKQAEQQKQEEQAQKEEQAKQQQLAKQLQQDEQRKLIALKQEEVTKQQQKRAEKVAKIKDTKRVEDELQKQIANDDATDKQAEKQQQVTKLKQQDKQASLQKQLDDEQAQLNSTRSQAIDDVVAKYKALITNAIAQHWLIPDSSNKNLSATLDITLAPGGVVIDVKLVQSSGDAALDRSAIAAVYKSSPLPVPADTALFDNFRELNLTVKPENVLNG